MVCLNPSTLKSFPLQLNGNVRFPQHSQSVIDIPITNNPFNIF